MREVFAIDANEADHLVPVLKVLADESRLRILGLLSAQESSVEQLSAALHLKSPTISHHLSRLAQMGLVSMRPAGNVHYYKFCPEALQAVHAWLNPDNLARSARVTRESWEQKVLHDFFNGDQLKEIPASRKKRSVVLRWLAECFEPGVRYSEAQVNAFLGRHHPDVATLRRELIADRLLARERGIYWRVIASE